MSKLRALHLLAVLSVGAPIAVSRADEVLDVVITEVMYNPASGDSREDFIELHNRSATETYNLLNWRFTQGVVFTFPDVDLGPREYLVVCADEARIRQIYGIANTVGDWAADSTLDNGGERIRLENDDDIEIEDFTYDDRDPWPIAADGLGHSLERRRTDYDNDEPANWGASATGTAWTRYSVTGLATSSTIYVYLTAAGTCWVDDIRLYPTGNPGDNRITNGDFESGTAGWDRNGNHSGSSATTSIARSGSQSLEIDATGAGGSGSTSVTRADLGLVIDDSYTLEFWVLFDEPGQSLVVRLSGSGGEASPISIEAGGSGATPGTSNSLWTDDFPPFPYPIEISPSAPTSRDDVTILAVLRDDNGIASVTAHYDDGGGVIDAPMFDDGAHGDGFAGDGLWGVDIGSYSTGEIVRYWVTAIDSAGQEGRFPFVGSPTQTQGFYIEPRGIDPAFPLRSNSGLASDRPPVYHLLIDPGQLTGNPIRLTGDLRSYRQATFVYDGRVYDNMRVRHRGQSSLGRPKKHWKFNFNKDHRFRTPFEGHPEVDNINIQSSEGDKSFLREYLSYKAFMDVGLPGLECWHVRMYINGVYRGLFVHMENPNEDWLDRTDLDAEGWLWKSYSQARSGSTNGFEIKAPGPSAAAANSALGSFLSAMNSLQGQALVDYINDNMDVDAFTDFLALHQLMHNADHPAKNYLVYADEDAPAGTWTYLLWDADLTHGRNFECSGGGVWNDSMRFDMWSDAELLFGTNARPKCDGPWNGVINAFLLRTTAFRQPFYNRTAELLGELYHPDVLIPIIDDLSAPLVPEVALDWQINRPTYGRNNDPNDYPFHVDELRRWVRNRHDYLSSALSNLQSPGIEGLGCERIDDDASLTWTNRADDYDEIRVYRGLGALADHVATLPGDAESVIVELDLDETVNSYRVASVFAGNVRPGQSCTIIISGGGFTTLIDEDFLPPAPAAELSVNCQATQASGRLQLTEPTRSQAGAAYFRTRVPIDSFIADFDLNFDDPSSPGADGMAFILNTGADATACGAGGGAMGYFDRDGGDPVVPGYAIVFDTWQNAGEPSHNWCGFIDETRGGTPRVAEDVQEEFCGAGRFHARVIGENGAFTLLLSNSSIGMSEREIFSYQVSGWEAGQTAFVGFSAGTGGAVARHTVDNVVFQVGGDEPDPPRADFAAAPTSGEAPLEVRFTDNSSGEITSRQWDFGDGETSSFRNPRHTYDEPGAYTVRLTVSGPGGEDDRVRTDYIRVRGQDVVAEFVASPVSGVAPFETTFTNQSTGASQYLWEFGDGSTSFETNPSHTYVRSGQYTVSLTAIGDGAEHTRTRTNYIRVDGDLVADFDAVPRSGEAPLEVEFVPIVTGGEYESLGWQFGDGQFSSAENPTHTYEQEGTYDVTLQVIGFTTVATETKRDFIRVGVVGGEFVRGDANGDGGVDLSDAVSIFGDLFLGQPAAASCRDALDTNDSGSVDISDGIFLLGSLFQGGPPPPEPHPNAGVDPTPDGLPDC